MDQPLKVLRVTKGEWYFVHALATYAILTVGFLIAFVIRFRTTGDLMQMPAPFRAVVSIGIFAVLWFWVRMLVDYFRQRPARHPVAWGFALVLGSYLAGIVYFFKVWRQRNQLNAN